jgi:hypothetical protein
MKQNFSGPDCDDTRPYLRTQETVMSSRQSSNVVDTQYLTVVKSVFTVVSVPLRVLNCLTFEDGTDRLSRNVGNYQSTLRNTPEERRPYIFVV